jgi:hypothetical protein
MATEVQAPIDPHVVMPRAVREGLARAEAAFHAAKGTPPEETSAAPTDPPVTPEVTLPVDFPVIPEVTAPSPPEDFAHKYNSMKGRFERSQEQIRGLSEQIKSLQALIATSPPATNGSILPDPVSRPSLITDQERNDYGPEFLDVVGKRAKEEVGSEISALLNKVSQLEARLAGVNTQVSMSAREKLEATLTDKIPNWNEINHSDEFKAWLALPDPYSGDIRHNILTRVYERNLIPQTLAFFQGFLAEEAALGPATAAIKPGQNTVDNTGKIPLESLAAPGRAKTAAPPSGPTEKPIITRKEIADFYAASNSGQYRGRDDEKNRIEAEIFAAQREGRIR